MKSIPEIVCILSFCLATLSLQAQERFFYSLEVVTGVGIGRGPLATVTPQFVFQYDLGDGFRLGAGAGTRFASPCLQYITKNGTHSRTFSYELDLPVFLRLGYGKEKVYANIDAGYAVGLLSFFGFGRIPGGKKEAGYDGFFMEPHIGLKLGPRSALALGVLVQQSTVMDHVTTDKGTIDSPSYSTETVVQSRHIFTPAINLRYGFFF